MAAPTPKERRSAGATGSSSWRRSFATHSGIDEGTPTRCLTRSGAARFGGAGGSRSRNPASFLRSPAAHQDRQRQGGSPPRRDGRPVPLAPGPEQPRDARVDRRAESVYPFGARLDPRAREAPQADREVAEGRFRQRAGRAEREVLLHEATRGAGPAGD